MDKIICLVGPSGSGKTTIAKELEKEGYNVIQSYTTRKPRCKDEWGHTFITNASILHKPEYKGIQNIVWDEGKETKTSSNIIGFQKLYNEIYFAIKEQYQNKGISVYTVDPKGAKQVKKNVKDAEVITIFLTCDEQIRKERLIKRIQEGSYKTAQTVITEVRKRISRDREIFKTCKCDYVVDVNRSLKEVVEDIKEIIEEREN